MSEYTPKPGDIQFTQYLLPDGRKVPVWVNRPSDVAAKAETIIESGFRFECEMLTDQETISLTISDDNGDYAIETTSNGPNVPAAVDRLVLGFDIDDGLRAAAKASEDDA